MSNDRSSKGTKPVQGNGLLTKKEALLTGIAKLFYEQGYEKTSIRDLARSLGVPNSAFYYYFKTKQEMLFTIIDNLMENVVVTLHQHIEPIHDPEGRLLALIEDHINSFVSHRYESKVLIYEEGCLRGEYRKIIKKKERVYFTFVRNTIAEIIKSSKNAIDVNVATFALFGTLNWIYKWYNPDDKIKPSDLSKHIFSIILSGLKGDSFTKAAVKKPND